MMSQKPEKTGNRPTVPEVMDMETGKIFPVSAIFNKADYTHHQQRMADETARIRGTKVRYHCPLCHQPLAIRAHMDKTFYFRHPNDPAAQCPYRYDNDLTPDQINAIKYDGARESGRHLQIKQMLETSLKACKKVTPGSVFLEKAVKVREGDWKSWRRPDVQAEINGKLFAFEIQLSTTFLTVIAGRREFYLRQGGLLLWIFDEAFLNEEEMRFTERDVFYNNNSNLFYLTSETVRNSMEMGECRMICRWQEPTVSNGSIQNVWRQKEIGLSELTFDFENQRAYYFDYDSKLALIEEEQKSMERLEVGVGRIRNAQEAAEAAYAKLVADRDANLARYKSIQEGDEKVLSAIRYEQRQRETALHERKREGNPYFSNNAPLEYLNPFVSRSMQTHEQRTPDINILTAKVRLEYGLPAPHLDTAENFGNYWIRASLEQSSDQIFVQEVVWNHYSGAFNEACRNLRTPLPQKPPKDYREILSALYSLREGCVIGFPMQGLCELEDYIFNHCRWFYRYFAFAIRHFSQENELKTHIRGSACNRHIAEYKANYKRLGFIQNRSIDPLIHFLFPEMAESK